MNGIPEQLLVSLGMSTRFTLEQVEDIYEGIYMACEKYNVDLVGGDTTSSLTGLTIGVTAVGRAGKENIVKRSGAKPNDLICVTGDFGAAFMGLQLLERERKLFVKDKVSQPDLSGYEYIIGRQLKPEIPVNVLIKLREAGIKPASADYRVPAAKYFTARYLLTMKLQDLLKSSILIRSHLLLMAAKIMSYFLLCRSIYSRV